MKSKLIVIAGGIGSGKSVVSRVLVSMGYCVYDCDSRARRIMDHDIAIKREIASRVSRQALLPDFTIDRAKLADIVFADRQKLDELNKIVHSAVREDINRWVAAHAEEKLLFVETAIPYASGIDKMADGMWMVDAPEDERVRRVCERNGIDAASVRGRIESQRGETALCHPCVTVICNDGKHSLLLQIDDALRQC